MATIGAVVIAKDEEHIIGDCLRSLQWMDEIIVVDDGSTDRTVEIAKELGAKVIEQPMVGFASQRNTGIDASTTDWLFHPDADMVMSEALAKELRETMNNPDKDGYAIWLDNYWLGQLMKYGSWRYKPRLMVAPRHVRFVKELHEVLDFQGEIGVLRNTLAHYTDTNYSDRLAKSNQYSSMQAQEKYDKGDRFSMFRFVIEPFKYGIYYYVYKQGFRDGLVGFIHFLHVVFVTFVLHIKLWEIERDAKAKGQGA
jgi:glycosyltransferase involved in cell wall biosynthesis